VDRDQLEGALVIEYKKGRRLATEGSLEGATVARVTTGPMVEAGHARQLILGGKTQYGSRIGPHPS